MRWNLTAANLHETVLAAATLHGEDRADIWTRFPSVFEGNKSVRSVKAVTIGSQVAPFAGRHGVLGPLDLPMKFPKSPPAFPWTKAEQRIIGMLKDRPFAFLRHWDPWAGHGDSLGEWWEAVAAGLSGVSLMQPHSGNIVGVTPIACGQLRAQLRWIAGARVVIADADSWVHHLATWCGVPVLDTMRGPSETVDAAVGFLTQ